MSKEDSTLREVWDSVYKWGFKFEGQITVRRIIGKIIRWVLLLTTFPIVTILIIVESIASSTKNFIQDKLLEWIMKPLKKFEDSGTAAEKERMWKILKK